MTSKEPKPETKGKARIFIVDDHPVLREGLSLRINRQVDLTVCGEADNPGQALKAIGTSKPDLALVDLSLKDGSGLDLIKNLKQRHPKLLTLVLSMHEEDLYAERALRAGARGYIMKHEATENVIVAIRRVLSGKVYLSEKISSRLLDVAFAGKLDPKAPLINQLTDRELEVFELLGEGLGSREISLHLHLSIKTIEAYREHIKEKLRLKNSRELIHQAILWKESPSKT